MQAWLRSDHSDEKNIIHGAEMLLSANRNKGLFIRISRNPKRNLAKLEYEIRKQVNIRTDGLSIEDVEKLDAEITPQISVAIDALASSPEGVPAISEPESEGGTVSIVIRGMRPDHEQLPDEIKVLWTKNAERWNKIKSVFELLKTLEQPCDRYEYLKQLKDAWYQYRKDMNAYDDYVINGDATGLTDGGSKLSEQDQHDVDLAQAYISKNLPVLLTLVEASKDPDFADEEKIKMMTLRNKLQERVMTLVKLGVELSDDRKQQLKEAEIVFEVSAESPSESEESPSESEESPSEEVNDNSSKENAEGEGSE